MSDWEAYKAHVRATDPEIAKDIDEAEALSAIVGAMIKRRQDLKLTQRELAELCGMPQSSVARIETGQIMPKMTTLLRILKQLGLSIHIQPDRDLS